MSTQTTTNNQGLNTNTQNTTTTTNTTTTSKVVPTTIKAAFLDTISRGLLTEQTTPQNFALSSSLNAVLTDDRIDRLLEFKFLCRKHAAIQMAGPISLGQRMWDDDIQGTRLAVPVAVPAFPAAAYPARDIVWTKANFENVAESGNCLKLRCAYTEEQKGFSSDWHRGMRADQYKLEMTCSRMMDMTQYKYVSWFLNGMADIRWRRGAILGWAAAGGNWNIVDRANGAGANVVVGPHGMFNTLDLRPDRTVPLFNMANHLSVHPRNLMFTDPVHRHVEGNVFSHVAIDHNAAIAAVAPAVGPPVVVGVAAVPTPQMPAALPTTKLLIVSGENITSLYTSGVLADDSQCVYVSRARDGAMLREITRMYYAERDALLVPQDDVLILLVPNMTGAAVRSALEITGYRDWRAFESFNLAEMATYIMWLDRTGTIRLPDAVQQVFAEDIESMFLYEADRRFRLGVVGQNDVRPLDIPGAVVSFLGLKPSWGMLVANVLGLLGDERVLTNVPSNDQFSALLPAYGLEMHRWIVLSVQRMVGDYTNLVGRNALQKLGFYVKTAVAAWSISPTGGGISPLIISAAPDAAAVQVPNELRIWAGLLVDWFPNLDYDDIWGSGDVVIMPKTRPNAPNKVAIEGISHDALRNLLVRKTINGGGAATMHGTSNGFAEGSTLTCPAYGGYVPVELITRCGMLITTPAQVKVYAVATQIPILDHKCLADMANLVAEDENHF